MPEAPPDEEPALHVEALDVTYGRALSALRSVSLTVPHGTVVALLGANGAGKTTLLRAVSGTLRPLFPFPALATWHRPTARESARRR